MKNLYVNTSFFVGNYFSHLFHIFPTPSSSLSDEFVFFSFLVERKLFIASATASAVLPRPQRQRPRHTFHIYNPSPSFRGLVFLAFASATTAPLRVPVFLVVVGFISFYFGLLGLRLLSFSPVGPSFPFIFAFFFCYFLLSWAWTLSEGSTVVWPCVPSAVLPRSFRKPPKQN